MIFRGGRFYATAAIAGSVLYIVLQSVIERTVAATAGTALIAALRTTAVHWGLSEPIYGRRREEEGS